MPDSQSQPPVDTVPISNLERITQPLQGTRLTEFISRVERGWNCVRREPPVQDTKDAAKRADMPVASWIVEGDLVQELTLWISETLDTHLVKSQRHHADAAIREFLCTPSSNSDLLSFLSAFASAYEHAIRTRLEIIDSVLSSGLASDSTSIAMASVSPELCQTRMNRLEKLAHRDPQGADLFRLSEFAGCTSKELGAYLSIPAEPLQQRIDDRRYDICDSTAGI